MNLTPLALAAAYAALRGGDKEEAPAVAPAATPAVTPAPAAQIPARTDMTQMFGATQDAEDMAAGQAPSLMTQKNPSFKQAFAEARLAGNKTFQWNGKPYTTELADKATPAKSNATSKAPAMSGEATQEGSDYLNKALKTAPEPQKLKKTYRGLDQKVYTMEDEKAPSETTKKHPRTGKEYNKGGKIKAYAKGGSVSASKRGDGIAQRGKTRGMIVMCGGGRS